MSDRNLGVDLLRVISIALVVFSHYGLLGQFPLGGTHGVVIFFMVSGYCMQYSTHGRKGSQFLVARFWRLVPTLLLCASVTTLIEFSFSGFRPDRLNTLKDYVANMICLPLGNIVCDAVYFVRSRTGVNYDWVDGAYWSLLVEIRFYLLLWFLYYVMGVRRLAIAVALCGLFAYLNAETHLISKSQDFLIYMSFFAFGLSLRSWSGDRAFSAIGMAISILVFVSNSLGEAQGISIALNGGNSVSYAICFAIFGLSIALFGKMRNRFIGYLGILSYPLYLLHQDIGLILIEALRRGIGSPAGALIAVVAMLLLAAFVQYIVDLIVPLLKGLFSFGRDKDAGHAIPKAIVGVEDALNRK
jgi:peptidoglycan/LPS O-acetylase OafA/YrhL